MKHACRLRRDGYFVTESIVVQLSKTLSKEISPEDPFNLWRIGLSVLSQNAKKSNRENTLGVKRLVAFNRTKMDSEEDVRLTTFRPLSPDNSKSSFSLARFFQWKRHGARVEVKVDASKSQRPVTPLTSPRSSPKLQKRTKSPEPLQRSWSASPLIGRRSSAQAGSSVHSRRASPGHVHAVLGRLNAAAGGRGQVSTCR